MSLDEIIDMEILPVPPKSETVWPTTLLHDILIGRQKYANRMLLSAAFPENRTMWSAVVIEYSYAIAADLAGNDKQCQTYSQRALELEDRARKWDAEHGQ